MIRVLLVEDDPWSRGLLADYLRELPGVEVAGEAEDGPRGLALAAALRPDALFVDVELPGCSGVELVRALPDPRPRVVFVTAHPEHALEAFRLGAVHYLTKPVSRVELAQALSRLLPGELPARWLRIPARCKGTLRLLEPGDVDALQADLGDCLAWTAQGRLRVEGTLAHWETRLGASGFLRIHRNALVRLAAVKELNAQGLVLGSGVLPVSRRRLDELCRALDLRPGQVPEG